MERLWRSRGSTLGTCRSFSALRWVVFGADTWPRPNTGSTRSSRRRTSVRRLWARALGNRRPADALSHIGRRVQDVQYARSPAPEQGRLSSTPLLTPRPPTRQTSSTSPSSPSLATSRSYPAPSRCALLASPPSSRDRARADAPLERNRPTATLRCRMTTWGKDR